MILKYALPLKRSSKAIIPSTVPTQGPNIATLIPSSRQQFSTSFYCWLEKGQKPVEVLESPRNVLGPKSHFQLTFIYKQRGVYETSCRKGTSVPIKNMNIKTAL